jgi:formylglycine-generating enzyme required for sulfatase activity/predicted MFS family arabinose efflux permease
MATLAIPGVVERAAPLPLAQDAQGSVPAEQDTQANVRLEMTRVELSASEHSSQLRKAVIASTIGTVIGWYDFFLFTTAAGLVFGKLFFPNQDAWTATILAFGTYFVGVAARPIGAAIFGHYGDRIGRKATLVATLLCMGLATFAVALVPTYWVIGFWGAVTLTILRFIQGLGLGGEWGGSVLLAMEWSRTHGQRGLVASWPQCGMPCGLLLSYLAVLTVSGWSGDQFLAWGWRIPFALSIVLVGVAVWIRVGVFETPVFQQVLDQKKIENAPLVEVFEKQPREIVLSALLRLSEQVSFYVFTAFIFAYAVGTLHISRDFVLLALMVAATVSFISIPLSGHISDRVGRKKMYMIGVVVTGLFGFLYFWLVDTTLPLAVFIAIVLSLIAHGMQYGPQAALISEVFTPRLRYSGCSLGYQLASIIAGPGLAPLVVTTLFAAYNKSGYAVAIFIAGCAVVSLVATALMPDYRSRDISTEYVEAARPTPQYKFRVGRLAYLLWSLLILVALAFFGLERVEFLALVIVCVLLVGRLHDIGYSVRRLAFGRGLWSVCVLILLVAVAPLIWVCLFFGESAEEARKSAVATPREQEDEERRESEVGPARQTALPGQLAEATGLSANVDKVEPTGLSQKTMLIAVSLALVLLAIAGGIVFSYYQPARPAAVSLSADQERALKPKDAFRECAICPEIVVIPAGSFRMGSAGEAGRSDRESPQHTVTIGQRFAVGRVELTFDQWDACIADAGCRFKPSDSGWGRSSLPVINVSWEEAKAYLSWLARKTGKPYRLLSEAEYEYAARAGTQTTYPWGNDIGKTNANCSGCGSRWDGEQTAPVGSFKPNGFGLNDMVGNVWEWVEDCYHDNYDSAPTDGSAWIKDGDCKNRVLRGGSWNDLPEVLRPAYRGKSPTGSRGNFLGFRVARTLDAP